MVHLHNGILLAHKKEGDFTFHNNMDGSGEYYAKWNKKIRQKKISSIWFHLYVESNEQNRLTDKIEPDS